MRFDVNVASRAEADWRLALQAVGIDSGVLLEALSTVLDPHAGHPVFLAGSIAEGLAVRSSDIDLYAICKPTTLRGGPPAGRDQISIPLGDRRLDLNLIDPDWLDGLIARLQRLCSVSPLSNAEADTFSTPERMTLHRLASGLVISGREEVELRRVALGDRHLQLKRHCALEMIKRRKYSAQALADAGDHRNLLFMCRDVADEAADLLLAMAGDGVVALKWRLPRLERAFPAHTAGCRDILGTSLWPILRDPGDRYFRLSHFPPGDDLGVTLRHARQVIGWADMVELWSKAADKLSEHALAAGRAAAARADYALRLDCAVTYVDGAFLLQRLNNKNAGWEISPQAAAFIAQLNLCSSESDDDHPGATEPSWDVGALVNFLRDEGFAVPI